MSHRDKPVRRRAILKAAGASVATLGLSGCTESGDGGTTESGGDGTTESGGGETTRDDETTESGGGGTPTTAGQSTAVDYADVSITMASALAPDHISVYAAELFKEKMADATDGAFQLEIVAGGSYGDQAQITGLAKDGAVDAHTGGYWPYFLYTPGYFFFGNPYVIKDWDHLRRVFQSDLMRGAQEVLINKGNQRKVGKPVYRGYRHLASNKKVQSPTDMDDFSLRLPGVDSWVNIWKEVGATPTSVAWTEVYSALQTGTAQGAEASPSSLLSINIQEVTSYLCMTQHMPVNGFMYFNEDVYQGLDQTYKDLINEKSVEATEEASEKEENRIEDQISKLTDGGMTKIEPDREAFREKAKPAVKELFDSTWKGTYELVQSI